MNRTSSIKRLYWLGDYRNIEFSDVIDDIPEEVALNPELMGEIRLLQLLQVEWAYRQYHKMIEKLPYDKNIDYAIKELEDQRSLVTKSITEKLKTKNGG